MSEKFIGKKVFLGESRTKQEFRQECDINHIVKKFKKINGTDYLNVQKTALGGVYGDFTDVSDYRTALERIKQADELFMAMPSNVRRRFNDNAMEFMDFANKPESYDEMVKLGLVEAKPVVKTDAVLEQKA